MEIFYSVDEIEVNRKTALSIGTFDGLHIGHLQVISKMTDYAKANGLATFIYTFSNNPMSFLRKHTTPMLIMDVQEKLDVLGALNVDYVAMMKFNEVQTGYDSEDFVREVVKDRVRAQYISVGHDFKFGHGAASTAEHLRTFGEKYGFGVSIHEPVLYRNLRVSSTNIRELLRGGDVSGAAELLGRRHFLKGKVVNGNGIGRNLGVPTLNIYSEAAGIMRRGVYFTKCVLANGEAYDSITNVGIRPTLKELSGKNPVTNVETHILGSDMYLYGDTVKIEFLRWHRDEREFDSISELSEVIHKDVIAAEIYFSENTV